MQLFHGNYFYLPCPGVLFSYYCRLWTKIKFCESPYKHHQTDPFSPKAFKQVWTCRPEAELPTQFVESRFQIKLHTEAGNKKLHLAKPCKTKTEWQRAWGQSWLLWKLFIQRFPFFCIAFTGHKEVFFLF